MTRARRLLPRQRTPVLLLAAMLGVASAPFPQPPASASCAAPYLKAAESLVLERGASVVVEGRAFIDGCQDSMTCSGVLGCESCEYDDPPPVPLENVNLRLVQRDSTWLLDSADAETGENNHEGWVTWTFEVPVGADPGPARLVADHARPLRIRVRQAG